MQIVIDIPKDLYDQLKWREEEIRKHKKYVVCKAILDGTILPKGHGRLIDADNLMVEMEKREERYGDEAMWDSATVKTALDMFAPTVVEAEKEEEG